MILDGKSLAEKLGNKLRTKVSKLRVKPILVIIQVGDEAASNRYIANKKTFGEKIGARVIHRKFPKSVSQSEILRDIAKFNTDKKVHGVIVQLPIPKSLDKRAILQSVDPKKDVDGLGGRSTFVPATTRGILTLLKYYKVKIKGQKVVVVGDSDLVGRPTALAMLSEGATVTVCNIFTKDLARETKQADILVSATGKPHLIGPKHTSRDQVVVDVGFGFKDGKPVGDVDFERVKNKVRAITPVPGGVGAMTVYSLFENLVKGTI